MDAIYNLRCKVTWKFEIAQKYSPGNGYADAPKVMVSELIATDTGNYRENDIRFIAMVLLLLQHAQYIIDCLMIQSCDSHRLPAAV